MTRISLAKGTKAALFLAPLALGLSLSQAAVAAEGAKTDEILVTATKRTERLIDVPQSIQALGEQDLQRLGADSVTGFARQVAGLSLLDKGPGQTQIAIRGISAGVQQDIGTDATVGVYIDEIPVSVSQAQPDLRLFDLDRIEILRGPQGTLYGSGSMGGTLRLITKRPNLDTFEGKLELTGSQTKNADDLSGAVNGLVNVPLVDGKLAARIVVYGRSNAGWVDDVNRNLKGVNDEDTKGGRVSLRYAPTAKLDLTFSALTQKSEFGGLNAFDPARGDLKISRGGAETYDDKLDVYNLTGTYDFGGAELTSSTSYSKRDYTFVRDFSGLIAPGALTTVSYGVDGFTQELRLASPDVADAKLNWVVGAFYSRRTDTYFQVLPIPGVGPTPLGQNVVFKGNADFRVEQVAVFGDVSYDIRPDLTASVGLRYYTADSRTSTDVTQLPNPRLSGTLSSSDSKTTPKFALAYKPNAQTLIYAQAAQGFRTGGANKVNPPIPGLTPDPRSFKPDSLWNYEAGVKGDWFDRRLNFTLAAFAIEWKDLQIQLVNPAGFAYYDNAGDARSRGVEAQASLEPVDGLVFSASATYTDAETKTAVPSVGALKGSKIPGVADFTSSLSAQYTRKMGTIDAFARVDASYVGESNAIFENNKQGDYTLTNVRLGGSRGGYDVELFVANATDERPVVFNFPFPNPSVYTVTPRTIGVTLRTSF